MLGTRRAHSIRLFAQFFVRLCAPGRPATRLGVCSLFGRAVVVALFLFGGCSLSVDSTRVQCTTDSDCAERGGEFANSICVASVCRAPVCTAGASCSGSISSSAPDACVGTRCRPDAAEAGPARHVSDAAVAQIPEQEPAPTDEMPTTPVMPAADDAGTASMGEPSVPMSAQNGQPSRPEDLGNKECLVDADCDASRNAVCVDTVCWSAADIHACKVDTDCASVGPEYVDGRCVTAMCLPNPRWRCERPPPRALTDTVKLDILVRDSLSLNAVSGVQAKVCQKLDLTCKQPLSTVTTGSDGHVVVTVPATLAGYLQLDAASYIPALYFLPTVLPSDGKLDPIPLLGSAVTDGLALSLGSSLDPKRGNMMLIAEDCFGAALSGVSFTSNAADKSTIQFYVRDLLPSTTETQTAEIGNGGYLNFPPGNAVIDVTLVAKKLKLTTVSVVVRAGFITVAYIRPELR